MTRTLVVADIHGHLDQLNKAVAYYKTLKDTRLVFVGDYIDRGPESYACLKVVKDLVASDPENVIALMGNHEEMFIDFLNTGRFNVSNGILDTIKSFKLPDVLFTPTLAPKYLLDKHSDLIDWIKALPLYYEDEQVIVAHAGILMNEKSETPKDFLLWAREEYMFSQNTLNKPVITGHTPTKSLIRMIKNSEIDYKSLGSVVVTEDLKYFIDGGIFKYNLLNAVLFENGKLLEHKSFT